MTRVFDSCEMASVAEPTLICNFDEDRQMTFDRCATTVRPQDTVGRGIFLSQISLVLIALTFFCYADCVPIAADQPAARCRSNSQPNIILINLDDVDWEVAEPIGNFGGYQHFPNLNELRTNGIIFRNFHVTTPLCGPSRACLITGQYAFKTDVRVNDERDPIAKGFPGGYKQFLSHGSFGDPSAPFVLNHLGTWLQQAGYRTMHVGKYLHNGFGPDPGESWSTARPPGWDEFYASLGALYFNTSRYRSGSLDEDGDAVSNINTLEMQDYVGYQSYLDPANPQNNYRTNVEIIDAVRLINHHVENFQSPFFMQLAPLATHKDYPTVPQGMIEVPIRNWWSNIGMAFSPDLNEVDISDKPSHFANLPFRPFDELDDKYRNRMLAMKSFDMMLGLLISELRDKGLLENTYLILTSDNGYLLGHHRLTAKQVPYDRVSGVPLYVCPPGSLTGQPQSASKTHLLAHIDLAPTILELAGANIPLQVDGKSFARLLDPNDTSSAFDWRPEGILLENYQDKNEYTVETGLFRLFTTYNALRLYDEVYVDWANGEKEYYDMSTDAYQLENGADQLSNDQHDFYRSLLLAHKAQMPAPQSFLTNPLYDQQAFCNQVAVEGYAEAPGGVGQVRLVISDVTSAPQSRLYWNGASWQAEYIQLFATLDNPDGAVTRWSYDFQLDEGSRRVSFSSRCYETDTLKYEEPPNQVFASVTETDRCAAITSPRPFETLRYTDPMVLLGWSSASDGIGETRLVIYNMDTAEYWNGQDWQTDWTQVQANLVSPGSTKSDWYYWFAPGQRDGFYWVSARAYNVQGRSGKTVHWSMFWTK